MIKNFFEAILSLRKPNTQDNIIFDTMTATNPTGTVTMINSLTTRSSLPPLGGNCRNKEMPSDNNEYNLPGIENA
jgi:hypothetical protein